MPKLQIFILAVLTLASSVSDFADADAAKRCARVVHQAHTEYIVNACNTCRVVNIRRKRRGIAMPIMRTFNVQANSKLPMSFRGPGRSRISSEVPCEGSTGAGINVINPKAPKQPAKQCVILQSTATGVVLINTCSNCRGAAVERFAANGRSMGRQAYKLNPLSVIPVKSKGAIQVSYLADVPC